MLRKKILIITMLVFIHNSLALADRPENELPMYGGERVPFSERSLPNSSREIDDFIKQSNETSKLGWDYFRKGDADTAIKRFNQAWLLDPNNPSVWWGFGVIMGDRGKKEGIDAFFLESINYLQKALSLAENNNLIMIDLSIAYTNFGISKTDSDPENALKAFDNALQWSVKAENINNKSHLLWGNRAYTQSVMCLFNDAIVSYGKAIELAPKHAESYNDFAWFLATCPDSKYRNGDDAVRLAKTAMMLSPNNLAIYDTLAAAYAELGTFEKAIVLLEKAINLQKDKNSKDTLLKIFEARLNSYKQQKPWRDQESGKCKRTKD